MTEYDDFLSLLDQDFDDARFIAFCGKSGSGKSTAIRFLLENHRDFAGVRPVVIEPQRIEHFNVSLPVSDRRKRFFSKDRRLCHSLLAAGRRTERSEVRNLAENDNSECARDIFMFSSPTEKWIVVDEMITVVDIIRVAGLLIRGRRVLAASHVPPLWLRPLRVFGRCNLFRTDRDASKLARYLGRQGVAFSRNALARFVEKYGATYTDLDIILERASERNFDRAFARFERLCSIA